MPVIDIERLREYRALTFHLLPHNRLTHPDQAVEFVNERGFVSFWPNRDVLLPSLWAAVAGDRPVPDEHDDPGHITWDWKDSLLGQRRWYYARVLRRRNTMISLETVPYFYALSENYGDPEEDYLFQYEQGRLSLGAKAVYEALLREGPLDTLALRRAARLASPESNSRFNRALEDLQVDFKILPVGISDAGAWHYAFQYDLTARHFPEIPEKARFIGENQARQELAELYWRSLGAAPIGEYLKVFGWKPEIAMKILDEMVAGQFLVRNLEEDNRPAEWAALATLQ